MSESPAELLAAARHIVPGLDLEEYTAARLAASEYGRGNPAELAAVIDATLNAAEQRRHSLTEHLTSGARGTYGKQGSDSRGGSRPASTRQDPREIHAAAARAVLGGELRGISRGAVRYFAARTQHALWSKGNVNHCDPLTLLRRWAFGYAWKTKGGKRVRSLDSKGRVRCELTSRRHRRATGLAWVGPVDGIDARRLMLMAPMKFGDEHTRRYEAARAVVAAVVGEAIA